MKKDTRKRERKNRDMKKTTKDENTGKKRTIKQERKRERENKEDTSGRYLK